MGINYGCEKVRLVSPVPAGERSRARSTLSTVGSHPPDSVDTTRILIVEIEGRDKPAILAEWATRGVLA